jgi:nitroreductase
MSLEIRRYDTPIISTISTHKAKRVLRLALEYAVLAPSSHNTQPWLFRLNDNTVELYADAERILKTVDPHGREAVSLLPSVRRYYTLL